MEGYEIEITEPSGEFPLIDLGRDIEVKGRIKGKIDRDLSLKVELFDREGRLLRYACQNRLKDTSIDLNYPGLVTYKEELDPKKEKLKAFGFPELQVKDIEDPEASIRNATIKCFYDEDSFKAILVSGSDVKHGRIFDTGMDFTDEKGHPYDTLVKGEYTIKVSLIEKEKLLASTEKKIRIDVRKKVAIVRFNPASHRKAMNLWCKEKGIDIVNDTMPGYLEPYLGTWYYHMGLLPYYRANDITFYQDALVHMFVYLCDPTSTSYETELAYLQDKGQVGDHQRFKAYHYDIGEALIKGRQGKILCFDEGEDMVLCRIDLLHKGEEGVFDLSEKDLQDCFFETEDLEIKAGSLIAFMGVVKPWQLKKGDVTLKKDNTYEMKHDVSKVIYEIDEGDHVNRQERELMMDRMEESSIGSSVYEFYNLFLFDESFKGKDLNIRISIANDEGRILKKDKHVHIRVR